MKELTQAQQNLLNKITTTKTYLNKSNMTSGNTYNITVQYNGQKVSFHFHDNLHNNSDKNDLLCSLLIDADAYANTIGITAFMTEFDYTDKKQATEVYKACEQQYNRLHKLFNKEEIETLEEIFQDY